MPHVRPAPVAAALTVVLLLAGCDSDPTGPNQNQPTSTNIAGVWTFDVQVTIATGACEGEEGDGSVTDITITQTGAGPFVVNAKGFLGSNSNTLTGTLSANGNTLVIAGSYPEDGGTTTATHTLNRTSLTRFDGTESWNWTGDGGDCPGSEASVVAVWK